MFNQNSISWILLSKLFFKPCISKRTSRWTLAHMATHNIESSQEKKVSNNHKFRQVHKKHYKKKERALRRHKDLTKYFNQVILIKFPFFSMMWRKTINFQNQHLTSKLYLFDNRICDMEPMHYKTMQYPLIIQMYKLWLQSPKFYYINY